MVCLWRGMVYGELCVWCVCVYAMRKLRTWINVSRSLKLMCVYQVRYNV